jgi:hypothetical protein
MKAVSKAVPGLPKAVFSDWRPWGLRERTSEQFDVPRDFGILGIYLLAFSTNGPPPPSSPTERHLLPNVIYVGMSGHVMRRLERAHTAVNSYRKLFDDVSGKKLYFCQWDTDWPNSATGDKASVQNAALRYVEAKLIAEHALKNGRRPKLNRQ